MNTLTKTMPTSVKALPEGEGRVTALVSTYKVDKEGDRILPGAFESSIVRLHQVGGSLPILTAHDWADPQAIVGHAKAQDISETAAGLVITFQLDLETAAGQAVWKAIRNGSLREFSVGFRGLPGATRKAHDGAYEISDLDLVEVSVCHRGVNPETRVLATKADMPVIEAEPTSADTEELLARMASLEAELDTVSPPVIDTARVDAFVAEQAAEREAEKTKAAAAAIDADNLRLAAARAQRAVQLGEAVPVQVDGRMRPVSPTLTAQRLAEETKAMEAATRARRERVAEAEKIKAIDRARRAGTTRPSVLGFRPGQVEL